MWYLFTTAETLLLLFACGVLAVHATEYALAVLFVSKPEDEGHANAASVFLVDVALWTAVFTIHFIKNH